METLCRLSKWNTEIADRGPNKGKSSTSRLIIGADKWQWMIAQEKQNDKGVCTQSANKFYKGFCHLIPGVIESYKLDLDFLVQVIVEALSANTATTIAQEEIRRIMGLEPKEAGEAIDRLFQTNFNEETEAPVSKHIFGEIKDDED